MLHISGVAAFNFSMIVGNYSIEFYLYRKLQMQSPNICGKMLSTDTKLFHLSSTSGSSIVEKWDFPNLHNNSNYQISIGYEIQDFNILSNTPRMFMIEKYINMAYWYNDI